MRLSTQRQAILALIHQSDRHWDAEEVARALADQGQSIGIATVYRGLAFLENHGLIDSIQLDNKKRYEHTNKDHHDHFICETCNAIEEFMHPKIEVLQKKISTEHGFHMTGHQLLIFGQCKHCINKENTP